MINFAASTGISAQSAYTATSVLNKAGNPIFAAPFAFMGIAAGGMLAF